MRSATWLWRLLQFLPLSGFLIYAKQGGFTDAAWRGAFFVGSAIAAVETSLFLAKRIPFDRIAGALPFIWLIAIQNLARRGVVTSAKAKVSSPKS